MKSINIISLFIILTGLLLNSCNQRQDSYSGKLFPINSEEYDRYILVNSSTEDYLKAMIVEFGEIFGDTSRVISLEFGFAHADNWIVIKVPEILSFYDYHNLTCWFSGYEENENLPEYVIGASFNRKDSELSYLFYLDPNSPNGDTQVGVFNNEKTFFIMLPDAYEEKGNLKISNDINIDRSELIEFLKRENLQIEEVSELHFENQAIEVSLEY